MNAKRNTVSAKEVADELGTTPMRIKAAIQTGALPIGIVIRNEGSTQDRVIIPRTRYEAWRDGADLKK